MRTCVFFAVVAFISAFLEGIGEVKEILLVEKCGWS